MHATAGRQPPCVRDAKGGCGGARREGGSWRDPKWRRRRRRWWRRTREGGSGRERESARTSGAGICGEGDGMTWKRAGGRADDAGSLADYVAGWSGERNPGEDAVLRCRSVGRSVGGVESALRRPALSSLLDRGEYIRNVLPPPTLRSLDALYLPRRRRRHRRCESSNPPPPSPIFRPSAVSGLPSRSRSRHLCPSAPFVPLASVIRVYLSSFLR